MNNKATKDIFTKQYFKDLKYVDNSSSDHDDEISNLTIVYDSICMSGIHLAYFRFMHENRCTSMNQLLETIDVALNIS